MPCLSLNYLWSKKTPVQYTEEEEEGEKKKKKKKKKKKRRSAVGAFFQELTPEIKVTVAENSERHSMTPTYIHK